MRSQVAPVTIPEVLEDEDGEKWWLPGHVEAALMVLAVVFDQMVNVGYDEAGDLLTGGKPSWGAQRRMPSQCRAEADGLLATVRHVWMAEDAANEETMHYCEPDAPGAMAFTMLDLSLVSRP